MLFGVPLTRSDLSSSIAGQTPRNRTNGGVLQRPYDGPPMQYDHLDLKSMALRVDRWAGLG
jgi:hypothetical protein